VIPCKATLVFLKKDLNEVNCKIDGEYFFTAATESVILSDKNFYDGFHTQKQALNLIRNGKELFVYKEGNDIAYYVWIEKEFATINWMRLKVKFPKEIAYLSAEYTVPSYRNKGIACKIRTELMKYLKKQGVKFIFCVVHPNNEIALKLNKSNGFVDYQIATLKRFLKIGILSIRKNGTNNSRRMFIPFSNTKFAWQCFFNS